MHALNNLSDSVPDISLIVEPSDCTSANAGTKGFNLKRLRDLGFEVPEWFVLSQSCVLYSLSAQQRMQLRIASEPQRIVELTKHLMPSSPLASLIRSEAQRRFGTQCRFAVRSSCSDEDGETNSFAGQMDSLLNVSIDELPKAVSHVWRSAYSERNLTYRKLRGARLLPEAPCVLIQQMCEPDHAGVAFSCNPINGNRSEVVINSVQGLADEMVAGTVSAECITVCGGKVLGDPAEQSLPQSAAVKIAQAAISLEQALGLPQDIEWAICAGRLILLQARPITSIASAASAAVYGACETNDAIKTSDVSTKNSQVVIWDSSNIGESYPGVTTPLTFSFARTAYENAYLQFCKLMGVPKNSVAANRDAFSRMIGYVDGRIYYNLLSWYQVLSILPGFSLNRKFMEQMMGVSESLPTDMLNAIAARNSRDKWLDTILSLSTAIQSIANLLLLPQQVKRFNERFERALKNVPADLESLTAVQLVQAYRDLERQLLTKWDAPLTNDFFAMIFYGALKSMCGSWCGDTDGTLQNSMLTGITGVVSTVPAEMIAQLTAIARDENVFPPAIGTLPDHELLARAKNNHKFSNLFNDYIIRFGDRCAGELKLETQTLRENPALLLRQIAHAADVPQATNKQSNTIFCANNSATSRADFNFGGQLIKRALFSVVLKQARARIRDRENLRFQRTRIFGVVRRIFNAIGRRMAEHQIIESHTDIFYLEVPEILGTVDGTITNASIKSLVALRKSENAFFQGLPAPPDRIETYKEFAILRDRQPNAPTVALTECLKGTGCSPGKVSGAVRVLQNPNPDIPLTGSEIVVADRTDPGWILVFPQARGLIVEHGSLLSHSAIVSRELGLPAVIGVTGVTQQLKDGDVIEMDGSTGVITVLKRTQP